MLLDACIEGVSLSPYSTARNTVQPRATAVVPQTIQQYSTSTANLQDWRNSSGTLLTSIDYQGNFSAPSITVSGLTAFLPVFTSSTKVLVSQPVTGSLGSVMLSVSPTTTGTLIGAASTWSGVMTLSNSSASAGTLLLTSTTAGNGLTVGADTNLYRSAANAWTTDDSLTVALGFTASTTSSFVGVATFTAAPIFSSLSVSLPMFTNGSKSPVSNTMTGTGAVMMNVSPVMSGLFSAPDKILFAGGAGSSGSTTAPILSRVDNPATGIYFSDHDKMDFTVDSAKCFGMESGGPYLDGGFVRFVNSPLITDLIGTGTRLLTITAAGYTSAATTIAGAYTFSGSVSVSGFSASQAVFTDGSKNMVSNSITGSGSVVMSVSPTLTGTAIMASIALSGRLNIGSAVDASGYMVNAHGGYIAVDGGYAFRAYDSGVPGDANTSFIAMYGDSTNHWGIIATEKSGSGSYRDMRFQTSGTTRLTIQASGPVVLNADLKLFTVGNGIYIAEGTNGTMGRAQLTAGAVTINNTKASATCEIFVSSLGSAAIANAGFIYEDSANRVAGTSFTVKSLNILDTQQFCYLIVEVI